MADPFLGEVRIVGFTFAPQGWAACNGALLPVSQYSALFSLVGAQFGGDGSVNFGLPNLASRHMAGTGHGPGLSNYALGDVVGVAAVTLRTAELPPHTHSFTGRYGRTAQRSATPTGADAIGAYLGATPYATVAPDAVAATAALSSTGGGQPHANLQPLLGLLPIIAIQGEYPSFD